jgi:hypothetical protein
MAPGCGAPLAVVGPATARWLPGSEAVSLPWRRVRLVEPWAADEGVGAVGPVDQGLAVRFPEPGGGDKAIVDLQSCASGETPGSMRLSRFP